MTDSEGGKAPRCGGFGPISDAGAAAVRAGADTGGPVLPILGALAGLDGNVALFLEVPYGSVAQLSSKPVPRTSVRTRGYAVALFAIPKLLQRTGPPFGYLVANPPITLFGDIYQPGTEDFAVALAPCVFRGDVTGTQPQLLGPPRCSRCNHELPLERAELIGPAALCVRCQVAKENLR